MTERVVVGRVQPRGANRQIAACMDECSLWVEIAGPKGGSAWQMSPEIAREVAAKLGVAADMVESSAESALTRRESRS